MAQNLEANANPQGRPLLPHRRLAGLLAIAALAGALATTAGSPAAAQAAPNPAQNPAQQPAAPPQAPGQTPPIAPNIQPAPLPPRVTIPAPPAGTNPPDVPATPINANEAVLIALRHQPNVTVAQQGIVAAQGRTQASRSGLLPRLGIGAGYTYSRGLVGTTAGPNGGSVVTTSGYQASANVNQLVYDFNHTVEQVRASEEQERAAVANLTAVQSDLVLAIKQAFYTYVQDERLVDVNAANVQNQQTHLAEAQARLSTGLGLPSDVVRAQTAVADAVLNLSLAQQTATNSRINLALQMGIDPRTPITTAASTEPAPPSTDVPALVNTAMRQRPEILQAQANVRSAEHSLNAAKTTNAPSLGANLGFATRGNNFPPNDGTFSIGASLNWDLFDAGLTAGLTKEARASLEQFRADLRNTQLQVTSDVSQAYLAVQTAAQRVTTSDSEVANAQEALRLAEGRYRAGLGLFIDVIDAQQALVTAQANRVNAQSALDQARAALNRAIGAPVPGT